MKRIRRAALIALSVIAAAPGVVRAQTPGRTYRFGVLRPGAAAPDISSALFDTLRAHGYAEGGNLVVERRFAAGRIERMPALASELVRARCDVILAIGAAAALAVREATSTIPILAFGNFDPVAKGLVSNLARPDANLTAVLIAPEGTLAGKRIELLREVVPQARRIALLAPPDPQFQSQLEETQTAAQRLRVELLVTPVHGTDYAAAFERIAAGRPDALVVGAHSIFSYDRKPIIALAARHRLPAMYEWAEQVRDGGLMSYGASLDALYVRVAGYAAQLLGGRRPAELPIEQPSSLRLVVNRRTAAALGLVLPQALLLRADEVIE